VPGGLPLNGDRGRGREFSTYKKGRKIMNDSISWAELAELTHATQVEKFGFCTCEDNQEGENPYQDCPKEKV